VAKKRKRRYSEQNRCRFCRARIEEIDYKDVATLSKLATGHGKLHSRKRSGNCARHQHSAKSAVKMARFLGLMPYVG
jgi:small subunit ribosomal protein S18